MAQEYDWLTFTYCVKESCQCSDYSPIWAALKFDCCCGLSSSLSSFIEGCLKEPVPISLDFVQSYCKFFDIIKIDFFSDPHSEILHLKCLWFRRSHKIYTKLW